MEYSTIVTTPNLANVIVANSSLGIYAEYVVGKFLYVTSQLV